ncbi:MAG: adenylate/guanylate cyclase domain-containing protein [Solirubrobacteraceae bacterium]
MQPPPTRYVERDGVAIAYQVVGDGPIDLLMAPGFISHLDLQWTEPRFAHFLTRLASFSRLILYDKPGTGLSDPVPALPTLEERVADIEAVLDAAGSTRAIMFGISEGGPATILLSAMRPERVQSLIICGSFATARPEAYPAEVVETFERSRGELELALATWGDGAALRVFAPSLTGEVMIRFYGTFARAAASPRMARALIEALASIDVTGVLSAIRMPALVMHTEGDRAVPVAAGKMLADGLPNARFMVFPGNDHAFWLGDCDPMLDEIERFVTGSVAVVEPDRALATVLFTDIVGSTEQAARLGDRAWREVLERHDALVASRTEAHSGRVIKSTGDGALATFGGPAKAIRAAQEICDGVTELGIAVRAGVHTGECELIGDDIGGLAVHIGARVAARAGPGEVMVSRTVKDLLVGSGVGFIDRGEHELKGVPGSWLLYAVGEQAQSPGHPLDAPAAHMRASDRIAVQLARRAPRAVRFGARLVAR